MNVDFSKSSIRDFHINYVGNKYNQEPLILSVDNNVATEETILSMKMLFLNNTNTSETYRFYHDNGIKYNVVFDIVHEIFKGAIDVHDASYKLSQYLYDQCTHPNIKAGEFYVVLFNDCVLDGETIDAIGLFKTENRDVFLEVDNLDRCFKVIRHEGVSVNKLDKGCLILNADARGGYFVKMVDNTNRFDAQYWVNDFLHLQQREDEYYKTNTVMKVVKNFITKELSDKYCVSKADQSELLNRTVQYFKEKEEFDVEEFANEVIEHPDIIDSFNQYSMSCFQEEGIKDSDSFYISDKAVKKQARSFKSVIKLDKNFHIYVHGNRSLIEQGEDEKGRFYKVYYNEEY